MLSLLNPLVLALLLPAAALAQTGEGPALAFTDYSYPVSLQISPASKAGDIVLQSRFSAVPEDSYDTVLLQGEMPDPNLRLDLIGKSASIFTANPRYELTGFRRFPNGRFWARYKAPAAGRQPVKLSVTDLGVSANSSLLIYSTELLTEGAMKEPAVPASTAAYVPDPSFFVPLSAPFKLVRRAEWSALPPTEPYTQHKPYYFTLHHTQAHYPKTYSDAVAEMQFIQDFHQNGRKWIDIAYHFLIDPAGNIFEGRPINVMGSHVKNRNTGNVGISIMGNYHPPANDPVTDATINSFVGVGRYIKDTYDVNVSSFYAHRDIGNSDCPGDGLYARKAYLRDLVFQPAPQPVQVSPADAALTPAQAESVKQLFDYLNGR